MRRINRKRILAVGFVVAIAVLSADSVRSFRNTSGLISETGWLESSHAILSKSRALFSNIKDAEASVSDYVLTGAAGDLASYKAAVESVHREMADLREKVAGRPAQQETLGALAPLIAAKLGNLAQSVEAYDGNKAGTALQIALAAKRTIVDEKIRSLFVQMEKEEERQLAVRSKQARRRGTHNKITVLVGDVLSIALLLWVFYLLNREITQRERAEERIRNLNTELEQRVVELHAANEELEAFSYSVSHDLRSPLAVIGGFAHILQEDYADKLDDESRRFLNGIVANAAKMGQLIDDLLAFSRLGRQPVRPADVDMEDLTRCVLEELRLAAPGRDFVADVRTLPPARGDSAMIRQVLTNLLSNAVKFTRGREKAMIEVGATTDPNEITYYVKDNGVGFDMAYANKLFSVFQRLHGAEEFEGTGVGLAIVQRIVQRHGGRVWAEGKVNEGATFYFTLPR